MPVTIDGTNGITTPTYGGTDTSEYLVPVTAFKNRLINGSMAVWQRGTSFSLSAGQTYTADRWITVISGSGSTSTISQQATTPAELTSFEMQNPQFYLRYAVTTAGSVTYRDLAQRIEDVRTFAGQNVTVSFYAKAASSMTVGVQMYQGFGSGGSADVSTTPVNVTIGTSWQRYTVTIACPSISGKTVGAGSMVATVFIMPNSTFTFDLALVQSEYGSTATSFDYRPYGQELALCQRYLPIINGNTGERFYSIANTTTNCYASFNYEVEPRVPPTGITVSSVSHFSLFNNRANGGTAAPSNIYFAVAGKMTALLGISVTGLVANDNLHFYPNSTSAQIRFEGCEL